MDRYICIHGHFYQPPRENPWLEDIEQQDSAYPYHDWNERITAECYAPNTVSRLLDGEGRIIDLPNNYAKISFNLGPTLLAWMAIKAPETYEAILVGDRMSQEKFSGHGSALAQAYNHMIMPLANRRDKYTQVVWGLRDFEFRFGRAPEGMWLPETAVDLETLDILAELGVRFTILAPSQAKQVRPLDQENWTEVSEGRIDPTCAYELALPSGRQISLFFYDGPISRAVAFEGLLSQGENLARRLTEAFAEQPQWPQLVHIATDGETYGHHQRFGDMALSYALQYIEEQNLARLTNYGEYLEKHPPAFQVEIFENTSWSCAHGVERWWKDCGCNSGGHPGWNQGWRQPLRESLDWLRDRLAARFETQGGALLKDPWTARDAYIQVILDRSPENIAHFLGQQADKTLGEAEQVAALNLLEMQRCALLMYTSCGWFFDELSGLETVQVLRYAGRALRLAEEAGEEELEGDFLERLEGARSNIPEFGDGRRIYEKFVQTARLDLEKVGTHYAVSSLFEEYPGQAKVYCYYADQEDFQTSRAGISKMAVGRIRIISEITREATQLIFGALHFGEQNLYAGVQKFQDEEGYKAMAGEVMGSFAAGDIPLTIQKLDRHFGTSTYSLRSLFRDEQLRVLDQIMAVSLEGTRFAYRNIYTRYLPLMRFLTGLALPVPQPLLCTANFVLNLNLGEAFDQEELDPGAIHNLLDEAAALQVQLDGVGLEFNLRRTLERLALRFRENPADFNGLRQLEQATEMAVALPFAVNLWKVQNLYYEILHTVYPEWHWKAEHGNEEARNWVAAFVKLGQDLSVKVD